MAAVRTHVDTQIGAQLQVGNLSVCVFFLVRIDLIDTIQSAVKLVYVGLCYAFCSPKTNGVFMKFTNRN